MDPVAPPSGQNFSYMYAVIQDKKEAVRNYLHAALFGHDVEAYNCLGLIYENFECLNID